MPISAARNVLAGINGKLDRSIAVTARCSDSGVDSSRARLRPAQAMT